MGSVVAFQVCDAVSHDKVTSGSTLDPMRPRSVSTFNSSYLFQRVKTTFGKTRLYFSTSRTGRDPNPSTGRHLHSARKSTLLSSMSERELMSRAHGMPILCGHWQPHRDMYKKTATITQLGNTTSLSTERLEKAKTVQVQKSHAPGATPTQQR